MFEGVGKLCPDCKAELSDKNKYNPLQEAPAPISKSQESIAEIVDATKDLLRDNPELCEELEAKIMEAIRNEKP